VDYAVGGDFLVGDDEAGPDDGEFDREGGGGQGRTGVRRSQVGRLGVEGHEKLGGGLQWIQREDEIVVFALVNGGVGQDGTRLAVGDGVHGQPGVFRGYDPFYDQTAVGSGVGVAVGVGLGAGVGVRVGANVGAGVTAVVAAAAVASCTAACCCPRLHAPSSRATINTKPYLTKTTLLLEENHEFNE
jgi:hypothetical protein